MLRGVRVRCMFLVSTARQPWSNPEFRAPRDVSLTTLFFCCGCRDTRKFSGRWGLEDGSVEGQRNNILQKALSLYIGQVGLRVRRPCMVTYGDAPHATREG